MLLPVKLWRMARIFGDYKRRRTVVRTPPLRLWIESASACNLRCLMCPNKSMAPAEKGVMALDLFRKIVAEVKSYASDVYLHHRGEPLLNPALFDMIACARAAGLKTRFHTNGTLLTAEKAARLLDAGPDLVSFSIDGFEQTTYEKVRAGAVFEQTLDNIFELLRRRRERGLRRPYVVIEKIVFTHTHVPEYDDKVRALTRRFLEAGVDEVIAKEEYVWAEETAPEPAEPAPCAICTFPWYAAVICWDGTVTPCPQDFHARMNMGNVSRDTLLNVWNGPAYQDLRRRLVSDLGSLVLCRKCDRLRRKTVGGVPLQYMFTFLTDQLVGYNRRLRRLIGTSERN
jgi:radical SAM protein with 4Fe4S-binding SPASM domain